MRRSAQFKLGSLRRLTCAPCSAGPKHPGRKTSGKRLKTVGARLSGRLQTGTLPAGPLQPARSPGSVHRRTPDAASSPHRPICALSGTGTATGQRARKSAGRRRLTTPGDPQRSQPAQEQKDPGRLNCRPGSSETHDACAGLIAQTDIDRRASGQSGRPRCRPAEGSGQGQRCARGAQNRPVRHG